MTKRIQTAKASDAEFELTDDDLRTLRRMKIRVDEPNENVNRPGTRGRLARYEHRTVREARDLLNFEPAIRASERGVARRSIDNSFVM